MISSFRKKYDYARDNEFQKLIQRSPVVDLFTIGLEISRDANPEIDFEKSREFIEQCVQRLRPRIIKTSSDLHSLELVRQELSDQLGFSGDIELLDDPKGSCLSEVIARRAGIPVSLSLIYITICRELGIELQGVAAPAHFMTRCDLEHETVFVDPFHGGKIRSLKDCVNWLKDLTGLSSKEIRPTLQPASNQAIVLRMLNNLKRVYSHQESWKNCWLVQNRIFALQSSSRLEFRDLGIIALKAGHPGTAAEILSRVIPHASTEEFTVLKEQLELAKQQLTLLN